MNTDNIALSFSLEEICNDLLSNCNLISKNMVEETVADIRADVQSPDSQETRSLICRAITEGWGKVKYQAQRYITQGRSVDDNSLERIAAYADIKMLWTRVGSDEDLLVGYGSFTKDDIVIVEHPKPTVLFDGEAGKDIVIAVADKTSFDAYDAHGKALVLNGVAAQDTVAYYDNVYKLDGVRYNAFRFPGLMKVRVVFDDAAFAINYERLNLLLRIDNFNRAVTDALKSSIHKFMVDYVTYRFLKDLSPQKAAEYEEAAVADQESIRKCLNSRARLYTRRASWL